jgi:hypothetical protein
LAKERIDTALTLIIGSHDEKDIFKRNNKGESPEIRLIALISVLV